jgi:NadR type nicotinamide-nucleotide adenylyltransferase
MLKIAIIGPESTGKSEMAKLLAEHFGCLWVPEYAREYCASLNRECTLEDELNMFHGQLALENKIEQQARENNHPFLFCDTTIITVKVWCEHVFGFCPPEVEQEYQTRVYDLYLLMKDDLPWQDDPLRNFPNERAYFMDLYVRLMVEKAAKYVIIDGLGKVRFENAIKKVNEL